MSTTNIPVGDAKAVKRWSPALAYDVEAKSYFAQKFIGMDENAVIHRMDELRYEKGDTISFDLSVELRNEPIYGDSRIEGKEEELKFFTDQVKIDQVRHAANAGGAMSQQRTLHDLRGVAKKRLSSYFAAFIDQSLFCYLSGARGVNEDFKVSTTWTGFAGNAFTAPDSDHLVYGGAATSKATLVASDTMTVGLIEKLATTAAMIRAQDPENANMVPIDIDGEKHFVLLMSTWQAHSLRNSADWLASQRAAAAAEGQKNPLFKGKMGMVNNVVLHEHSSAIRFSDYGAGANVGAARALFMGRQAGCIAYATPINRLVDSSADMDAMKGLRFRWIEQAADAGNLVNIYGALVFGIKKPVFNGRDFGLLSVDTAAKAP